MQLSPQEKALFEQLGRTQPFLTWLEKAEAEQIKVLKLNKNTEQIYEAQGMCRLIDSMKAFAGLNK